MKNVRLPAAAASLSALLASSNAHAQNQPSVSVPIFELTYESTGVTDNVYGEVKAAPAYGDFSHGAHGTFLKMPGKFTSPVHFHTSDEWGVIIAGVFVNGKPGSQDILLPAPALRRRSALRSDSEETAARTPASL